MGKGTALWPVGCGGFGGDAQQIPLNPVSAAHNCRHLALVTCLVLSSPVLLPQDSCINTSQLVPLS